jgi:hypothetical protein
VVFRGKPVVYHVEDWDDFPLLKQLAERVGEGDNYAVVQYYPHGGVGIKPHRDREMVPGTTITGVSLGACRDLTLNLTGRPAKLLPLENGSAYKLRPPTNDCCTHSIEIDDTRKPRWSVTFRRLPL